MERIELLCDHCGKTEKGDEHHYGLPKGWYILGYHCQSWCAPDDWRVKHHFCSWECLSAEIKVTGKEKSAELEVK